jgi:hypothetical protein
VSYRELVMLDSAKGPSPEHGGQKFLSNVVASIRKTSSRPDLPENLTAAQMGEFRKRVIGAQVTTYELAEELALTLGLAQRIRSDSCQIDGAYNRINFVFDCLLSKPSKLVEARGERLQLQFDAYRHSGGVTKLLAFLSGGNPTGVLLLALLASVIVWTLVAIGIRSLVDNEIGKNLWDHVFFMSGRALAVISSAAFIGGVISIAIRLRELSQARDLDPLGLFLTVMFKPLIGVVLSWFILALLAGDIISFGFLGKDPLALEASGSTPIIKDKVLYALWILGFFAGFSERFAWDFVDRAEGLVVGSFAGGRSTSGRVVASRIPTDQPAQQQTVKRKHKGEPRTKSQSKRKK